MIYMSHIVILCQSIFKSPLFKNHNLRYNICKIMEERGDFVMNYLFEGNLITYTFLGLFGLGIIVRTMLAFGYKHLLKDSARISSTGNKTLKHMKSRFQACYKLKIGVHNVDAFVDKNLLTHKFGGLILSTWENLSGQILYLSLLLVPVTAIFGVYYDCGQKEILYRGAVGILVSSVLIIVDKSINITSKREMVHLNLMDYFENFYKARLDQEISDPESVEQFRKEYLKTIETDKVQAKNELDRRREARKKREEARKKKEAEKRIQAQKREEEKRRIELARKKEEERRRLVSQRREEDRLQGQRLLRVEESPIKKDKPRELELVHEASEEIAAAKSKPLPKRKLSPEEEEIIEDVLKEFFS